MVVLSAVVRAAGLPSAAHLLVWHGLRSAAWRVREGALRLVIAGLLCWRSSSPSSSASRAGAAACRGTTGGQMVGRGKRRPKGERAEKRGGRGNGDDSDSDSGNGSGSDSDSSGDEDTSRKRTALGLGWDGGGGNGGSVSGERPPASSKRGTENGGGAQGGAIAMDKEQLLCNVGSLLMDERSEVRCLTLSNGPETRRARVSGQYLRSTASEPNRCGYAVFLGSVFVSRTDPPTNNLVMREHTLEEKINDIASPSPLPPPRSPVFLWAGRSGMRVWRRLPWRPTFGARKE